jgi:hypothetical protein
MVRVRNRISSLRSAGRLYWGSESCCLIVEAYGGTWHGTSEVLIRNIGKRLFCPTGITNLAGKAGGRPVYRSKQWCKVPWSQSRESEKIALT